MRIAEIAFDQLVLRELRKLDNGRVIPFPVVFYRLGCMFHFDKDTSRLILQDLEKKRLIRIHEFHGVEILQAKDFKG